jgi:ABC-type sugar transport system substrate-binding protein
MKKSFIWLNVIMALFLLLSACAQPTQEAPPPADTEAAAEPTSPPEAAPEDIIVGAVLFGRDSFFENIQRGMELAAEEQGVELLVSIHDHDIAKETEFIEDYIARGVDAIVITPESLDASVAAIKQAYDAGIKIVCFNTCINETDAEKYVSAFYETDQASLGYQTGEYLADWLGTNMSGEDVNVGILQCDRFEACKRRGDGFRAALADKGVEWNEVGNQEGFMPDEGSTVAESMLQASPEINILWSENEGGTVGEVIAVRTMGLSNQVFVFGTDISPQLAEMLLADDNILQAVTGQSPRLMGGDSVRAAVSVVKGEQVEYYHIVPNAFYSREDTAAVNQYLVEYGAPPEAAPTAAPTEAPAAMEEYIIGAVLFGRDSFFENIQNGMETAAEEAGVELLVSIHDHDIAKETEFIEDYIARGVDAIVITPESLDASVAAIKQAYDAGITIVCFNTCINETDAAQYVSAFYETDQASLGYQTGEYLADWLGANMSGDAVNVGILQCDRFEACKRRGDGFREALADKGVEWTEVGNQEGFMPDEGSTVAESMLQASPEINILWSENEGGTVGEVIAVRTMGLSDQVFVFGTDISPQLAEMLLADDNILQAVTGQSPRLMGSSSVLAAVSLLNGEAVEYYHIVPNAFYSREDTEAIQQYLDEY